MFASKQNWPLRKRTVLLFGLKPAFELRVNQLDNLTVCHSSSIGTVERSSGDSLSVR